MLRWGHMYVLDSFPVVPDERQCHSLCLMETIHFFVELLDTFFQNVCELDIVFNFNKVYMILDEYILAGEVQETSKNTILERVHALDHLD